MAGEQRGRDGRDQAGDLTGSRKPEQQTHANLHTGHEAQRGSKAAHPRSAMSTPHALSQKRVSLKSVSKSLYFLKKDF